MSQQDRIYCGACKVQPEGRFGIEAELMLYPGDVERIVARMAEVQHLDDRHAIVRIKMWPRKQPGKWATHTSFIDTWQPPEQDKGAAKDDMDQSRPAGEPEFNDVPPAESDQQDNLPF